MPPKSQPGDDHPKARRARKPPSPAGMGSGKPPEEAPGQTIVVASGNRTRGAAGLPTAAPYSAREQRADLARIVRRLEAIVTNHLEGARRIHHPLTLAQIIAIIDALRAEATGTSRPVAFSDGEVAFYLMDGLYEELLGEPSNIFYATSVAAGGTRFEPLQRDFWLACLEALRQRMERLGFDRYLQND